MRKIIEMYKPDGTILPYTGDEYYTYTSNGMEPLIDIGNMSNIIVANKPSLRAKDLVVHDLNDILEDISSKSIKMNEFSLNRFNETGDNMVLVGQGSSKPIWKTFDSIFPSSVYEVSDIDAYILEGSTFLSAYFSNSDVSSYIFNNTFINKLFNYNLDINTVVNTSFYASTRTTVKFIPFKTNIVKMNSKDNTNSGKLYTKDFSNNFTVDFTYNYDVTKIYSFYVYNKATNTVRPIECSCLQSTESAPTGYYRYIFKIPSTFTLLYGDDFIYSGDIDIKSSLTDKSRGITNYVSTDIDIIRPVHIYNTEIKGASNVISSTIPVNIDAISVSIAEHHGFYIDSKGILHWFGNDQKGEITNTPSGKFKSVYCGKYHNIAIKEDDSIISWGSDDYGQISGTPTAGKFNKVYAYDNMSAAISTDNELFIWGDNLFKYDTDNIMTDVMDISIGEGFIIILKVDGSMYCIGSDTYGQSTNIPVNIKMTKICAGKHHCCALSDTGVFYIWGTNKDGQMLNSTITDKVIDICCTNYGGGVLTENNTFKGFGKISGTSANQTQMVSGYDNIVLLKSTSFQIEKEFTKVEVSGDAFNLKINIDIPDVVINKIYTELEILE